MTRLGTLAIDEGSGVSSLYRDYVTTTASPVHGLVGGFRRGDPAWKQALAGKAPVDPRLVASLLESNAALGVSEGVLQRLRGLADGSVRCVVTGQQPGALGGPLLTLYKIATAVTLARELEREHGIKCVPVYWVGSDDDDFEEIRHATLAGADLSSVTASLPASAYQPGLRVGDIAAEQAVALWSVLAPLLATGSVAGGVQVCLSGARDLGHFVARLVALLTNGEIAIIDGRDPALRVAGRDLLLSFFDREDEARASIAARGTELTQLGYHAQLPASSDSGLFLVDKGVRQRVPAAQRDAARTMFAADIARVSPGVAARNLLQDAVLKPVAVVLGAAEIAYRAQLTDVYATFAVARPVAFPRLAATWVPARVREVSDATGVDPVILATDPAAFVRAAQAASEDPAFAAAASGVESELRRQSDAFLSFARARLDARAADKLEKRLLDVSQRLAQALAGAVEQDRQGASKTWPFLARAGDLFVHDGVAQERVMGLLAPALEAGPGAWNAVRDLAGEHTRDALDARMWHGVYSV